MSEEQFKAGVYQLHAIDESGKNQYFDQSGFLRSQQQLQVWFESICGQHKLPEGSNWYPLNEDDKRFQIVTVMQEVVEESPVKAEKKKQQSREKLVNYILQYYNE